MSDATRLLVSTRKGLVIYERRGDAWRFALEAHLGIPVAYSTLDARSGVLWACLDHGHWGQKLQRSRDGGQEWEEVVAPAYPEGAEIKPGEPATLKYLWVLQPDATSGGQRLYIGTEPGGLFRSDDGGEQFQLVSSLWNHPSRVGSWFGGGRDHAGIHSVVIDPRQPERVLVGVSCAGVFETTDGCKSWTPRNRGVTAPFLPDPDVDVGHDPHLLVACPAQPDILWQQNHCGIFRSTDGAKSWSEVSEEGGPARFGFAVAVDAEDGDTAWVVPALSDERRVAIDGALCVCRTNDGGQSWQSLRRGLPQECCYDIVLRHSLDVSGDTMAFATTTGNLFVSSDGGESWQCLSHHLAPVYAVRFAV